MSKQKILCKQKASTQEPINTKQSCSQGLPWKLGMGTQNGENLLGAFGKLHPLGMFPKIAHTHTKKKKQHNKTTQQPMHLHKTVTWKVLQK